ncbi:MAG: hypothetical protein ACXU95_12530, partial [Isosphaeraceae bacterium]
YISLRLTDRKQKRQKDRFSWFLKVPGGSHRFSRGSFVQQPLAVSLIHGHIQGFVSVGFIFSRAVP